MNWEVVDQFEKELAKFFGSPYAICTDSCTHGVELCLRYTNADHIIVPKHTYLSIPMLANKLWIDLFWKDEDWVEYYYLTKDVIDAAVLWRRNSYVPKTFMCVSMQYQKHLSLGRGGVILTDDCNAHCELKKMVYDGRIPNIPWREQGNIKTQGYHYYMTIETAQLGLEKLPKAIQTKPKQWVSHLDWPDISDYDVFQPKKPSFPPDRYV